MWVRGASIGEIAQAIRIDEPATLAYLASRKDARTYNLDFHPDLRATVSQVLPSSLRYYVVVDVEIIAGRDSCCEVRFVDLETYEPRARLWRRSRSKTVADGRCDLLPLIEPLMDALWLWLDQMRRRSKGVSVRVSAFLGPQSESGPLQSVRPPDFRPLAAPLLTLLAELLPVPRPRYSAYDKRLEVEFGNRFRIDLVEGQRYDARIPPKRVTKARAGTVWNLAKNINEQMIAQGTIADRLVVYVSGDQLPDEGDSEDEVYDPDAPESW